MIQGRMEIRVTCLRPRWKEEEIELLAAEEANAPHNVREINTYLLERMGQERTLEGIKGIRRRPEYRARVRELRRRHLLRGVVSGVTSGGCGRAGWAATV